MVGRRSVRKNVRTGSNCRCSSRTEPNKPPAVRIILFTHNYFLWADVQDVGFQSTVRVQYTDYPAEAYFEVLILDGQYLADSKR